MKAATAIKRFLDKPGYNPDMIYIKPNMTEIRELKDSCSAQEWQELGRQACEALGVEFEAV